MRRVKGAPRWEVIYLADAVGTQTEAIAVRGLSLTRSGITHLLTAELGVGTLIGAALGPLATVIQDILSIVAYFLVLQLLGV